MSLAGTIRTTARRAQSALTPATYSQGDMDILTKLKKEHREVQLLLDKLVDSERAAERKSLLKQIKGALVPHSRAEEKVVYDALRALRDKEAKQDGEEGYLEHGLADRMLATLGKASAGTVEFAAAAKVLRELLNHHIREEESSIWSDVKDNFSDEQREQMNRDFEAAKKKVRVPQ
ncbi:MAG: hemerythrin domain-containing protein [Alphaproteobacteria bacterium]|nr:hemerythrin domain-containing protein [Alphaproteobacteria bacterium]